MSDTAVRATLLASAAVFAVAAAAHLLRYLLLLINRTRLLPPLVADGALLMGVLASLAAIAAAITMAAVATSWLIGRRAVVFRRRGQADPRPEWTLWAGCLVPVVNLVWAPLFVIELADAEQSRSRLRNPITTWWAAWILSTAISGWAIWTSAATEPQAVADNTVTMIVAYLAGLAVLVLLWRVFDGFAGKPAQRPLHRWVIVAEEGPDRGAAAGAGTAAESADAVESGDREPAA